MQAINIDVPLQTMQTLSGLGSGDRGKPSLITDSSISASGSGCVVRVDPRGPSFRYAKLVKSFKIGVFQGSNIPDMS